MIYMIKDSLLDNLDELYDSFKLKLDIDLLPTDLSLLDKSTISLIKYIDKMYQNNIISHSVAVDIIASIFKGCTIIKINNKEIYLNKLQELYKLLENKYRELIYQFNIGDLNKEEFLNDYRDLKSLSITTLAEMEENNAILKEIL